MSRSRGGMGARAAHRRRMLAVGPAILLGLLSAAPAAAAEEAPYAWPVRGPVLRAFEEPATRFEAGHRGIDIGASFGTPVGAAADGVVAFAGFVAGSLFVSIDHPDGIRTTYSWLSDVAVRRGEAVSRGQVIAATGHGHPEEPRPHLHFGARVGAEYLDPLVLLGATPAIHLAPLGFDERSPRDGSAPAEAAGLPAAAPEPAPAVARVLVRTEPHPAIPAAAEAMAGP